jgi:hypothetical protein
MIRLEDRQILVRDIEQACVEAPCVRRVAA